jgi:hypothetical protein
MLKVTFFLLGLALLTACASKTSNQNSETRLSENQTIDSPSKRDGILNDSIAEIKRIGSEILKGLDIKTINEKYVYYLIHNIMVTDSSDRAFYFKVFNKIRVHAGGYVAYEIGFYSKDYCKTYPNEFFFLSDSLLKSYAIEIGDVISSEEAEPNNYAKDYVGWIKEKTDKKYSAKAEQFCKDLLEEMERNK